MRPGQRLELPFSVCTEHAMAVIPDKTGTGLSQCHPHGFSVAFRDIYGEFVQWIRMNGNQALYVRQSDFPCQDIIDAVFGTVPVRMGAVDGNAMAQQFLIHEPVIGVRAQGR